MRAAIDMLGKVCGRLSVVRRVQNPAHREALWFCHCSCGATKVATGNQLRGGLVQSCGCLQRDNRHLGKTHGMSTTRAYKNWANMIQRCTNPKATQFKDYGARGIVVCRRWLKFENFYADMGECPAQHSIDRKKNDKGYSKGNCRWATRMEQATNKRNNRVLTMGGITLHITGWARKIGISHSTLRERLDRGWTVERSLTTPGRGAK